MNAKELKRFEAVLKKEKEAKERNKFMKKINDKIKKDEVFRVIAVMSYKYPEGIIDNESSQLFTYDDDNYNFFKAIENVPKNKVDKIMKPIQKEFSKMSKKVNAILKKDKFVKIPFPANELGYEEKHEVVDKWENDLFREIQKVGIAVDSEHDGYGIYSVRFVIPFNKPKDMIFTTQEG